MRNLYTSLFGVCMIIGMGLGMSAPASAVTSAVGPYYATPSWDQTLPAATRFIVLTNMSGQAVLDRETGLVWEQSPSTAQLNWSNASTLCARLDLGGRSGWRLPTVQDLASLIDRTQGGPSLPIGHPFSVLPTGLYFSATTYVEISSIAWGVDFTAGDVGLFVKSIGNKHAWCVRGGAGVDPQ